jgi:flagellar P-ring protein precursor FlgI
MPPIGPRLTLTLLPHYRYHTVSARVAEAINGALSDPQEADTLGTTSGASTDIAQAIDDTSIVVRVPDQERANIPQFVSLIMSTQVTLGLLQQPAEVRVNPRTGSIVFSGNVEISPVAVSHKNLVITTVIQPPAAPGRPAPPAPPQRITDRMIGLDTSGRGRDRARIQDLLAAFRQLDVPVEDRINIITQLHRAGRLHARLVVE